MSLRRHYAYLRYILRHKYFVFKACLMLGVPLIQALTHDLSKFLPSEWFPYAACFYRPDGSKHYKESDAFQVAWCRHQKRNLHHWQAWLVTMDRGETIALEMPYEYVLEMVADWIGAGLAITGEDNTDIWYSKHKQNMILHPFTRHMVEYLIRTYKEPST